MLFDGCRTSSSLCITHLEIVHEITWQVARIFGFQTFSLQPKSLTEPRCHCKEVSPVEQFPQLLLPPTKYGIDSRETTTANSSSSSSSSNSNSWIPSSAFVVTDHLCALLHNGILRTRREGCHQEDSTLLWPEHVAFAKAVCELHSHIFNSYETKWCPLVSLNPQPKILLEQRKHLHAASADACHMLLCELSLYFLIWTEAANTRHLPEGLWFLFWCCVHNSVFSQFACNGESSSTMMHMVLPGTSTRDIRVQCRNLHQIGAAYEEYIVTEMALKGDGGFWCSCIVTPLFLVLALEMDALADVDNCHRLGYDDVNESLSNKQVVHETLALLGVSSQQIHQMAFNDAFCAMAVFIGHPCSSVLLGRAFSPDIKDSILSEAKSGLMFNDKQASFFWSMQVARKTFRERRTWWAIFRAFHRVFSLSLTAFHLMLAYNLAPSDLRILSSASLTHITLAALERFSNYLICCGNISVSRHKLEHKIKQSGIDTERGLPQLPSDPKVIRQLRKSFVFDGAPVLCIFGFLEWILLAAVMIALFILQYVAPDNWSHVVSRSQLSNVWLYTAGAYTLSNFLHFIMSTRPGHCISLAQTFHLPTIFCASSCRPTPSCYVSGNLLVSWRSWILQVITWGTILAVKWSFEFFLVSIPLATELIRLVNYNWCPLEGETVAQYHCLDVKWTLVILTMAPYLVLVLVDGMIIYHAYLSLSCLIATLLKLNVPSLPEWEECIGEFHRTPARWWKKCTSVRGKSAQLELAANTHLLSEMLNAENDLPVSLTDQCTNIQSPIQDVAQWSSFSVAWDALIKDLREGDLLSDSEAHNCSFVRLYPEGSGWRDWKGSAQHVGPVVTPPFFYAGQLQKVMDTAGVNSVQAKVVEQLRSLSLLLMVELDIITGEQADLLQNASFLSKPSSRAHLEARAKMLPAAVRMVQSMQDISNGRSTPLKVSGIFIEALKLILQGLEVECRAAGGGSKKNQMALNLVMELQTITTTCKEHLLRCLLRLQPENHVRLQPENHVQLVHSPLACQLVDVLKSMLAVRSIDACPSSSEARRVISSFLNSLQLESLLCAPSLAHLRSLTVLTPLYCEDVMYCLDGVEAARQLGLETQDSNQSQLPDLLTGPGKQKGGVSLLSYLKGVHPNEWDNFRERIVRLSGGDKKDWRTVTERDFRQGGPFHHWALELQMWASCRAQVLARTVKGMLCCEQALKIVFELEHPCPSDMPRDQYNLIKDNFTKSKFTYLVAAQAYGKQKRSKDLRDQWTALCVELLLCRHPSLQVAYLDINGSNAQGGCHNINRIRDASVLIQGICCETDKTPNKLTEKYRVTLPFNPYSSRSIILGEGKPENQNHAIIFAFGEALQTIDSNQDSTLAEAFKMRNLLEELSPVYFSGCRLCVRKGLVCTEKCCMQKGEERKATDKVSLTSSSTSGVRGRFPVVMAQALASLEQEKQSEARGLGGVTAESKPTQASAAAAVAKGLIGDLSICQELKRLRTAHCSRIPVALVGFKEWIFSHRAGALASFAAATEYAFATVIQRDMAQGNVRLHYGHPDIFDKLHCMTRGGLSKATRGLHVSEDVMGGLNHTLRGAQIKYSEAVSVGKGRDMGFNSILAFETKISTGNGEVFLTREMARIAPRMDVFRLLHFYHSGLGYFLTARLAILGIYCQALALAALSLSGYSLVNTNLLLVIQIGIVSSLPFLAQLILETGIINASINFFQQLYAWYGRSHIHLGLELGMLAVVVAACGSAGSGYGGLVWGIWIVSVSLIAAPFWFNPFCFNMETVRSDWRLWQLWLNGEVDKDLGQSWVAWNRHNLDKVRAEQQRPEGHWLNQLSGIILNSCPHCILAVVAAARLTQASSVMLITTILVWSLFFALIYVRKFLLDSQRFNLWSRLRGFVVIGVFSMPIVFIVVAARVPWDQSVSPAGLFFLTLYVHLSCLLALHKGLSPSGALIDNGLWALDCISGTLMISLVAILSTGGLLEKLQSVLLFNRNFARSVKDVRTLSLVAELVPRPSNTDTHSSDTPADVQVLHLAQHLRKEAEIEAQNQAAMGSDSGSSIFNGSSIRRQAIEVTSRLRDLIKGSIGGSAADHSTDR